MIDNVIIILTMMLSFAMLMAGFRVQKVLKHEDSDKMRSGLFLQYDVFKRNTRVVINGVLIVLLIQFMSILFSIQGFFNFHRQTMFVVSVLSLFMVGFILVHINNVIPFTEPDSASSTGGWRAWLE